MQTINSGLNIGSKHKDLDQGIERLSLMPQTPQAFIVRQWAKEAMKQMKT